VTSAFFTQILRRVGKRPQKVRRGGTRATGLPGEAGGPLVATGRGMTMSAKRILVATDFSEGSDEALLRAIDLAKQTGASLEIVYVIELDVEQFPLGLYDTHRDLGAYVDRELGRRAEIARRVGVVCHTSTAEGNAATEIVKRARDVEADVIVVGTHGRKGLVHVLLGSVAERVVHRATCPVLTVPFSKKAA